MRAKITVTMQLTDEDEPRVEHVDFQKGADYSKYGLIDPNNETGEAYKSEEDVKAAYLRDNLTNNFFLFGGSAFNLANVKMIRMDVEAWNE